jgi:putative peptidoglycan lipid II flippase
VERALAARLPEGSLAALTYAYRLLHFPVALFVVNASAMLLPTLAGHSARGENEVADALTRRAVQVTIVFAVPLAALALALAEPLTVVLLQRGAFTEASTARTATAIAWYAPTVVALAVAQVLARTYQARRALWRLARTYQARRALWRLAATAGAGIALNVGLMTVLTPLLGFRGLPLAASLSGFALVALMLYGLRDRPAGLTRVFVGRGTTAVVAAGLVALAAAWLARGLAGEPAMTSLVAGAAAGIAGYAIALAALAPAEARAALAVVRAR